MFTFSFRVFRISCEKEINEELKKGSPIAAFFVELILHKSTISRLLGIGISTYRFFFFRWFSKFVIKS